MNKQSPKINVEAAKKSKKNTPEFRAMRRAQVEFLSNQSLKEFYRKDALTDPLTELNNRRGAFLKYKAMQSEIIRDADGSKIAVGLFDIDNFKIINDTYGHKTGDEVLQHIATTLKSVTREEDILVRWGGDEILVVLKIKSDEEAKEHIKRIYDALRETPCRAEDVNDIQVTSSIGLTILDPTVDKDNMPLAGAVDQADKAVYIVKESGRDGIAIINKTNIDKPVAEFLYRGNTPNFELATGKPKENRRQIRTANIASTFKPFDLSTFDQIIKNIEAKNASEEIEIAKHKKAGRIDPLTGWLNRRGGKNELKSLVSRINRINKDKKFKRPDLQLAMLALDIDFFRNVNNTYGHDVGDQVLKEFTRLIKEITRGGDICVREGGEEFKVYFQTPSHRGALDLSNRIFDKIAHNLSYGGKSITASMGVVLVDLSKEKEGMSQAEVQKESIDKAQKEVDRLLYKAKDTGRNRIAYINLKSGKADYTKGYGERNPVDVGIKSQQNKVRRYSRPSRKGRGKSHSIFLSKTL